MENPLVTILITTYNPKYLDETLKSADMQQYSPIEILLVDDGSKTPAIENIKKPTNHEFKYIYINHMGLPHGLIKGIGNSRGKYIAILDHDDVLTDNSISSRVDALESHPSAAYSYGDMIYINKDGEEYGKNIFKNYQNNNEFIKDSILKPLGNIQHSAIMFRKDSLDSVGGYDPNLKCYFDTDLVLRLAEKYDMIKVDEAVLKYRTHDSNTSKTPIWKLKSIKNKLNAVDRFLKSDFNNIDYKARVLFWQVAKSTYSLFASSSPKFIIDNLK